VTFAVPDAAGQRVTIPATVRIAARLAITTARLPSATVGEAYRARLAAAGGLAPKTWRIVGGSVPRGMSLSTRTGVLSGVPRRPGVYKITVQVRDGLGGRSTKTLRLAVTG
jgi:hypothetical protein